MIEWLAENRHAQGIHVGEIRGGQVTGPMHLAEHHLPRRTGRGPPLPDAPLERATLTVRKPYGILSPQPVEQRLRLEPRLRF